MAEILYFKKIDWVLFTLYEVSGQNPTFDTIERALFVKYPNLISEGEIQDILLYFFQEKLIYCCKNEERTIDFSDSKDIHYLITARGKILKEKGGFDKQRRKEVISTNLQSVQTWAIAIGTIGILIWEILKYYLFHCI